MTCFHACHLINLVERTNGLTGKHQKILVQEGQTIRYLTLPGEIVRDISLHGSTQVIVTAQVLLGLQLSEGHKCLCLLTGAGDKAADCSLTRTWLNSLSALSAVKTIHLILIPVTITLLMWAALSSSRTGFVSLFSRFSIISRPRNVKSDSTSSLK